MACTCTIFKQLTFLGLLSMYKTRGGGVSLTRCGKQGKLQVKGKFPKVCLLYLLGSSPVISGGLEKNLPGLGVILFDELGSLF